MKTTVILFIIISLLASCKKNETEPIQQPVQISGYNALNGNTYIFSFGINFTIKFNGPCQVIPDNYKAYTCDWSATGFSDNFSLTITNFFPSGATAQFKNCHFDDKDNMLGTYQGGAQTLSIVFYKK
jgi:hypothetical protein